MQKVQEILISSREFEAVESASHSRNLWVELRQGLPLIFGSVANLAFWPGKMLHTFSVDSCEVLFFESSNTHNQSPESHHSCIQSSWWICDLRHRQKISCPLDITRSLAVILRAAEVTLRGAQAMTFPNHSSPYPQPTPDFEKNEQPNSGTGSCPDTLRFCLPPPSRS